MKQIQQSALMEILFRKLSNRCDPKDFTRDDLLTFHNHSIDTIAILHFHTTKVQRHTPSARINE